MRKTVLSFLSNKNGSVSAEFVVLASCLALAASGTVETVATAAMERADAIPAEMVPASRGPLRALVRLSPTHRTQRDAPKDHARRRPRSSTSRMSPAGKPFEPLVNVEDTVNFRRIALCPTGGRFGIHFVHDDRFRRTDPRGELCRADLRGAGHEPMPPVLLHVLGNMVGQVVGTGTCDVLILKTPDPRRAWQHQASLTAFQTRLPFRRGTRQ